MMANQKDIVDMRLIVLMMCVLRQLLYYDGCWDLLST